MRASGTDKAVILKPPRQMTLEQALEYIEDDELVEVTPKAVRLRKIYLKENDRKKFCAAGEGGRGGGVGRVFVRGSDTLARSAKQGMKSPCCAAGWSLLGALITRLPKCTCALTPWPLSASA